MFGSSLIRDMQSDPFFRDHMAGMRQMDAMMGGMGGMMGSMIAGPQLMLPGAPGQHQQHHQQQLQLHHHHQLQQYQLQLQLQQQLQQQQQQQQQQQLALPRFGFTNIFENMNQMMRNPNNFDMNTMRNDPNSHFFAHSSMMTYNNTGEGQQPRIYQASSQTHQVPGQVRETRRSVRDSEAGVERMAVGREIGNRGHVIKRSRNTHTGDMDEEQEYNNLDEAEAEAFGRDWKSQYEPHARRITPYERRSGGALPGTNLQQEQKALEAASSPRRDHQDRDRGQKKGKDNSKN